MIIMRKFGGVKALDYRNLSPEVKKDVNLLFSYMEDIINPEAKIDKSNDGYYTRKTVLSLIHI